MVEKVDSKVRKKRSQERLNERISELPLELRLEVLEQWICQNPVRIGDTGMRHLLLNEGAKQRPLKERIAICRAAPVLREVEMGKFDEEDWLFRLEWPMFRLGLRAEGMPTFGGHSLREFRKFVEQHNAIGGDQATKHVRLHVKITLESTCRTKTRILYDGSADPSIILQPAPEQDCPYPTCDVPTRQARIVRNLELYGRKLAETTQILRQNISVEVCFRHKCSNHCLKRLRHPSEAISVGLGVVGILIGAPTALVAYVVVLIPIQAFAISLNSWPQYKQWFRKQMKDATGWKRVYHLADVGLISVGALGLLPLSLLLQLICWPINKLLAG